MKRQWTLALMLLVTPVWAQDLNVLTMETKKRVLPVVPQIMGAMHAAIARQGTVGAIPVCQALAPNMIQALREETGWSIRRVSLKPRNAEGGTPDAWEARQLAEFDTRVAQGEQPESLEKSEIVMENGVSMLRYMKALPVGDVCLKCHGAVDNMEGGLYARLNESYPHDLATGYSKGQIRGALTVKRPL